MIAGAPSRRRILARLAALAVVSGCTASPPARLFTLSARPGAKVEQVNKIIGVRPVDFPKFLDRAQLVRFSDLYELHTSEFERWGEGMRDMLTRVLTGNLAERLPKSHVLDTSGPLTVAYNVLLEIAIDKFDAEPAGGIVLYAQWNVRPDGRKPTLRSQTVRAAGPTGSPTELAEAMSNALATLSDGIAASIAEATA